MSETPEWVECRCDSADLAEIKNCGCGQAHLSFLGDKLIHWREQHWRWQCAFTAALEENDEMRKRLVKMAVDKIFQRRNNLLQDFVKLEED
jgi:hypothetical protein